MCVRARAPQKQRNQKHYQQLPLVVFTRKTKPKGTRQNPLTYTHTHTPMSAAPCSCPAPGTKPQGSPQATLGHDWGSRRWPPKACWTPRGKSRLQATPLDMKAGMNPAIVVGLDCAPNGLAHRSTQPPKESNTNQRQTTICGPPPLRPKVSNIPKSNFETCKAITFIPLIRECLRSLVLTALEA